jgi:putative nucleotidyltransferase with HDIG domain
MEETNEQLYKIIDDLTNQVAENLYQTIQMLASIVSATERFYEGSHSRFVSAKSAEVAQKLGMNELACYEIEIAGLLHDIGKITFKDHLLAKHTTEMKENEFKQYALHPSIGKQILNKHSELNTVAEIVLQHHEKIDGSGFPNHYQGKEILPGAAIISVVDTFHNMFCRTKKDKTISSVSSLQYANTGAYLETTKPRYSSTMNFLVQKAGVIFDSKVVETFIDIQEIERKNLGLKSIFRIPLNKLEPGMIFAEDYYTSYGLLIAARGEKVKEESAEVLTRFADAGEISQRILIIK